jgi:hypothetical protein
MFPDFILPRAANAFKTKFVGQMTNNVVDRNPVFGRCQAAPAATEFLSGDFAKSGLKFILPRVINWTNSSDGPEEAGYEPRDSNHSGRGHPLLSDSR